MIIRWTLKIKYVKAILLGLLTRRRAVAFRLLVYPDDVVQKISTLGQFMNFNTTLYYFYSYLN